MSKFQFCQHFEKLNFENCSEWVEYKIQIPEKSPEKVEKFARIIVERYNLKLIHFKNSKEILP
jgi:hypothetical protein